MKPNYPIFFIALTLGLSGASAADRVKVAGGILEVDVLIVDVREGHRLSLPR